jgi:hypothetical protein
MAFTRFHDDPDRITKQLQQQTDQERWYLDVPGNSGGETPAFMLDPHIIPQKWGANLWTQSVDINSSMLGIDRRLNRDCISASTYKKQTIHTSPIQYPICDQFLTTEQSRAIMPAWTAKDLQQNHAHILPKNPQAHTELPFLNNVSTRLYEKDQFKRTYDCMLPNNDQRYTVPVVNQKSNYMGGPITCSATNNCSIVSK